jgi:hypothetical protein
MHVRLHTGLCWISAGRIVERKVALQGVSRKGIILKRILRKLIMHNRSGMNCLIIVPNGNFALDILNTDGILTWHQGVLVLSAP